MKIKEIVDCFNTTLVQLKAACLEWAMRCRPLFQYHSGPIKSRILKVEQKSLMGVSIPLWSN